MGTSQSPPSLPTCLRSPASGSFKGKSIAKPQNTAPGVCRRLVDQLQERQLGPRRRPPNALGQSTSHRRSTSLHLQATGGHLVAYSSVAGKQSARSMSSRSTYSRHAQTTENPRSHTLSGRTHNAFNIPLDAQQSVGFSWRYPLPAGRSVKRVRVLRVQDPEKGTSDSARDCQAVSAKLR